MHNVAETSRTAFHAIKLDREIQTKQLLDVYTKHGPMSDREASYKLGWYPSQVAARRNSVMAPKGEMPRAGQVVEMGTSKDKDTAKTVNIYGIYTPTLF